MSIRNAKTKKAKHDFEAAFKRRSRGEGLQGDDETPEDISDEDKIMIKKAGAGAIRRLYIREYRGSPLAFKISLIKQGNMEEQKDNDLALFKSVSSLGLTITTFENAPLNINALEITNVFGDMSEVLDQFKGYYKQQVKWNALSFVGASNLIGNPVGFMDTIGTGMNDFWYEPRNGFMRGPREGAIGVVRGTQSLVKNTIVGSVGSIGKISSSLSSTMLQLTGDDQFVQARNRGMIRKQPKTMIQGLEQGFSSALHSGWSGIKGVVEKPKEGFTREGTVGLMKGVLSGAAGLFVKPIAGTMDMITKTSQGIENSQKNQADLLMEERLRSPRAFYGIDKIIREFDIVHANMLQIMPRLRYRLPEHPDELFQINTTIFHNAWILEEGTEFYEWSVLMLTNEKIVRVVRYSNK